MSNFVHVLDLDIPGTGRISILSTDPSPGYWSDAQCTLHLTGARDIVIEQDDMGEILVSMITALKNARELTHPEHPAPNSGKTVGYLYNKDSYEMPDVVTEPQVDEFGRLVVWDYKGNVTFLYREGTELKLEVSPFCQHIFGDWPEDVRRREVEHFFSNFQPHLLVTLSAEVVEDWIQSLLRLQATLT